MKIYENVVFQRFPDHDHAMNLMQFCIAMKKENMFVSCAIGVTKQLGTTKLQKVQKQFIEFNGIKRSNSFAFYLQDFWKKIENIVNQLPNHNVIWTRIMRSNLNEFGQNAQESLDQKMAKRVNRTGLVIFKSTMKNWSSAEKTSMADRVNSTPLARAQIQSTPMDRNNNNQ